MVIGGAGFIGSALVRGLLEQPGVAKIVVVDSLLTGHRHNLDNVADRIEFHQADIRDLATLDTSSTTKPLFPLFLARSKNPSLVTK